MDSESMASAAALCAGVADLARKYTRPPRESTVDAGAIVTALNQFQECVRYLNTRRSTGAILKLDSEAAVQDAIYLMLRPWISDLNYESPTSRVSNRYVIKDFISPSAETVIEIKFIRDEPHGKNISKEMHDDIEMYRRHPHCRTLVFFVYDPASLIPDQEALKSQIETPRAYGDINLTCVLIVKP